LTTILAMERVEALSMSAESAALHVGLTESSPWTPTWAYDFVREVLSDLPGRVAHSLLAGAQATNVARTVADSDAQLLITAALLHDIGYAPALRRTGFHPLDGATFLLEWGAPARLAGLVAHHSEAWLLAQAKGVLPALHRFPREHSAVSDALTYADMTAGPSGRPMPLTERLADIKTRHADEPPAVRSARSAREPLIRASVARVKQRAEVAGAMR
jgi:putative nucleotidyltransferase with HDIG domain